FEDIAAIADDGGVDRRREDVGAARLLRILRPIDDLVVDLLDKIHLRGADGVLAPISVTSHSTLPESTMARSLPKSAGLVSTTRMPYFFSYPAKKALRIAVPIEPPEWLTTIWAGLAGSAWAEAGPAALSAAAPPRRDTTSRRRRALMSMADPLSISPRQL